jgi:hypothetical protein
MYSPLPQITHKAIIVKGIYKKYCCFIKREDRDCWQADVNVVMNLQVLAPWS